MVLCFSVGENARMVPECGYLTRVGDQILEGELLASDLLMLGNLKCVINFHFLRTDS
jgi:hypothetical protein